MSDTNPSPEFEEKVRKAMEVPNADSEFVNKLRNELVQRPVKMKPRFVLKPAWAVAFAVVTIALIASAPAAVNALKKIFGYVPGVGLVESSNGLRILAEPVSVTRDGVTLKITNVFVYQDRVELMYEVDGIKESYNVAPDMCGSYHPDNSFWSDGDADLRLPDGTIVRRDYAGEYQFENRYAMKPVYAVQVPADVTELTMVLKCIPFTRLGDVPENWEVSFKLKSVPAGTVVGEPVIDVQATEMPIATAATLATDVASVVPIRDVKVTLTRVVPMDSATVFYLSLDMESNDPSLISIMPMSVYVVDSLGQKERMRGNFVWQPFEHRVGSEFEFVTQSKPAAGQLTIIVENAVAYYAPMYVDPPQATPEEMSFTFDAGAAPQPGQTWSLDSAFTIAGYPLKVTSARATTYAEYKVQAPDFPESQGYEYGYDFSVETDPSVNMQVAMDIMSENPICGIDNSNPFAAYTSSLHFIQLCREKYPAGIVRVNIRELAVLMENSWQVIWQP